MEHSVLHFPYSRNWDKQKTGRLREAWPRQWGSPGAGQRSRRERGAYLAVLAAGAATARSALQTVCAAAPGQGGAACAVGHEARGAGRDAVALVDDARAAPVALAWR